MFLLSWLLVAIMALALNHVVNYGRGHGKTPADPSKDAFRTVPARRNSPDLWLHRVGWQDDLERLRTNRSKQQIFSRVRREPHASGASSGLGVGQWTNPQGQANRSSLSQSSLHQSRPFGSCHCERKRAPRSGASSLSYPDAEDGNCTGKSHNALPKGPRIHCREYVSPQWYAHLPRVPTDAGASVSGKDQVTAYSTWCAA